MQIHIHVDGRVLKVFGARVRRACFVLAVLVPCMAVAATTVPKTFQAGTTISAADVNANFTSLTTSLDTFDGRITTIEAKKGLPSAAGIYAYVTTSDANATLASTFNSSGGAVTATGTTGDYTATFNNVTCVAAGKPVGAAVVVPFIASTAVNCRIGTYTQAGANCQIAVRCFDSTGNLRPGAISITYAQ